MPMAAFRAFFARGGMETSTHSDKFPINVSAQTRPFSVMAPDHLTSLIFLQHVCGRLLVHAVINPSTSTTGIRQENRWEKKNRLHKTRLHSSRSRRFGREERDGEPHRIPRPTPKDSPGQSVGCSATRRAQGKQGVRAFPCLLCVQFQSFRSRATWILTEERRARTREAHRRPM